MLVEITLFGIDLLKFAIGPIPERECECEDTAVQPVYIQNTSGNFEIQPEEEEELYYEEDAVDSFGFR